MRRWLYAHRHVSGPPSELEAMLLKHADRLLQVATGSEGGEPAADGSYTLALSAHVAGLDVDRTVNVTTGVAFHHGTRLIVPVTWRAHSAAFAFPTFEGGVELEPSDAHGSQLTLVGSYRTPLGPVGGLADAVALHRVADDTAWRLLNGLAAALADVVAGRVGPPPAVAGPRRGEPLRVADVMTPDPLTIHADLPLRTAALVLFHAEVSGAPVVSDTGELLGVLSERDLLAKEATMRFGVGRAAAAEDRRRLARTAADACTRPARVTVPDARLADVTREMLDHDVSRLIVVDHGKVDGIISRHDVLAALVREDADIELAVQRVLDAHDAPGLRLRVQWGDVTLDGTTRTRSFAEQLPALIAAVDGVMDVNAEGVSWEEDDIVLYPPYI